VRQWGKEAYKRELQALPQAINQYAKKYSYDDNQPDTQVKNYKSSKN
jgi:hypothetical protein